MSFLSSIPIWGWFDILFNFAVLVALCGESDWALKWIIPTRPNAVPSTEWRRRKLKKKFELLLIFGIAGEVACLPFSLLESSKLNKEAGDARVIATSAEAEAGELKLASVKLEQKVEELRKQNALLRTRRITQQQYDNFISSLKGKPKRPVKVFVEKGHFEAETFAGEIRKMLDAAGYGTNDGSGLVIADHLDHEDYIGDENRDKPVIVAFHNEKGPLDNIVWPHFQLLINANGNATYVYDSRDTSGVGFVMDTFKAVGIEAGGNSVQFLQPGEWAIIIPKRF